MAGSLDPDDGGQQLLLGKMLLERGLITPDQLREALVERARTLSDGERQATPLGGILVRKGFLTDSQLLGLMAEQQGADVVPPYENAAASAPSAPPVASGPTLPAISAPDPLYEGGQLGKYRLVRELGRGGMGVVYEALDSQLNRKVALKLMLTNPNADPKERALEEERFVQEAQLSAKLKHPHIVTVYEAGLLEGRQFLSMEMIEGQAFNDWRKTVTIRDQIQVLSDVSSAVHHAHEQGILHRDLKPRNILVSGSGHAYVTDFGLAKSLGKNVHHSLTGSGAVVGTPAYMSPEQAQGLDRVDWRTDIYSLGVILYECMTGRTPFTGESPIEILMKVVKDPVVPPLQVVDAGSALGLDKGIENICLKALAKKDRDRYVTAQAFADDLSKWLAGEKVHVVAPKTPGKANKRVYVLATLLLLAFAGGLAFMGIGSLTNKSVRAELDRAKVLMSEENFSEAMILYRVAMAKDPDNMEAILGAKAAQDGINRKDREREEKLRADVMKVFKEAEDAQLKALELQRKIKEAETDEERVRLAEEARKAEADARKKAEEAAKAEEQYRKTLPYVVPTPGTPVDAWKDAINLLPIIDPRKNAVWGTWEIQDGTLVSDRSPFARVEIPFHMTPAEYDFRMVFERRTGAGGVSVILSRSGRQFRCELGGESNTRHAFESVKQAPAVELPAVKLEPMCLRNDQRYTVEIKVRADGAKMLLNGKPVLAWQTDYSEIGLNPQWKLRNTLRLGVGSHQSELVVHRMELLEISGKGRKLESPGLNLPALAVVPAQLKPGLIGEYYLGTSFQSLAMRRIDSALDFRWKESPPWSGGPADAFSVRWNGFLHVPATTRYYFSATVDDGVRIMIDDQQVLSSWNSRPDTARTFDCTLTQGYHRFSVEYQEVAYIATMVLSWGTSPTQPLMPIQSKSFFHSAPDAQPYMAPRMPEVMAVVPLAAQNVTSVAFHAGGKLLAVAGEDKKVRLLDPATQKDLGTPALHPTGVLCVAFSPAPEAPFATGTRDRDNKVRVWDSQNRTELRTLDGPAASVQCVAFSPDGKLLAAGSFDQTIRVWSLDAPEDAPVVLAGHKGAVESVAFTRDGKRLASTGLDRTIRFWSVETGKPIGEPIEGHADYIAALVFTPGGRTLATAGWDGLIKLWDVPEAGSEMSLKELKVLAGRGAEVVCLAFSADGLLLAAGGNDGTIRIWDPVQGRELKALPGHTSKVSSLAFSPTGKILASGSADATVRFWNLEK